MKALMIHLMGMTHSTIVNLPQKTLHNLFCLTCCISH